MRIRRRANCGASFLGLALLYVLFPPLFGLSAEGARFSEPTIPGTSKDALVLGRDLDRDGDPDEITINLEVIEVQEEVYPGEFVSFWVFAPEGEGMVSPARVPSPTIRVEEGDRIKVNLLNTHYFPHTIHLHGTIHPNAMDGVPDITQEAVRPGDRFTYEFIAKNPGTHFYHCHVQPDVHVLMGLVGMLIIEPNRPNNNFSHLIPGAGRILDLAKAALEHYEREYSLVYMDIDSRLNRIVEEYEDPRQIEKKMHRQYDSTKRAPDIFLLNGRSFPFTLRDTLIEVEQNERVRLRVLNAGARPISLHTHGHHPTLTHLDGYEVPEGMRYTRDVFTVTAAQRVDLLLRTKEDGHYASGPGVWLMHDHTEHTVTNRGISPGGDVTTIAYKDFIGPDGLPRVATSLDRFFDPNFYRGEVPVFDPSMFHSTVDDYEKGWREEVKKQAEGQARQKGRRHRSHNAGKAHEVIPKRIKQLEEHRPIARSCDKPRGVRRIQIKAGIEFADVGEVFGFEPKEIKVGRCEEVEVVLENKDVVRHALMIPGLNPMFILEFRGPAIQSARFVTPDEDITLPFHCHVETHEERGMEGVFVVGRGGEPQKERMAVAGRLFQGVGEVVLADQRKGQIVVDHQEIPGFMAAMIMGYPVTPPSPLKGLKAGDRIRFTIDADQQAIIKITPLTFRGEGTVITTDMRQGQIVVDHKEIPGFMAPMIMGYPVNPPKLLRGLKAGQQIRFTIDAEQQAIVEIGQTEK
ncbi:MAG: multicopper oxidase domain-containing protein [Candidatus Binatia bacterium]